MPSYLFGLSEYDQAFGLFISTTVFELTRRRNPLSESFPVVMVENPTNSSQVTAPSGEVVETELRYHGYKYSMEFDDAIMGISDGLIASLDEAADQQVSSITSHLLEHIDDVTKAFGNNINVQGEPLSHDLLNKMLERVELSFDEQGTPIMPTLHAHPDTLERMKSLPSPTAEQFRVRMDIIERKRKEYTHRKRYGRLLRREGDI